MKTQTSLKGVVLLLLTALIWGTSFVAQSEGMESVDAFTFQGIRTLLGSLVLVPVILLKSRAERKSLDAAGKKARNSQNKKTWIYGSILGVALCIATNFQQYAFYHSTAGKIAFITAHVLCSHRGTFLQKKNSTFNMDLHCHGICWPLFPEFYKRQRFWFPQQGRHTGLHLCHFLYGSDSIDRKIRT